MRERAGMVEATSSEAKVSGSRQQAGRAPVARTEPRAVRPATSPPASRRLAPLRRIVGRELTGGQVVDRLECGHVVMAPYTGWQASRKCVACAEEEAGRA